MFGAQALRVGDTEWLEGSAETEDPEMNWNPLNIARRHRVLSETCLYVRRSP